ncbi:MAG: small ribosomal subunit biogenesis GTPase RsgA [Gammaproteobacteria bacterium]|nr:small ribosomal subunit biogenesis GTPase RsgA [Gammaproteobacteria bacterium]
MAKRRLNDRQKARIAAIQARRLERAEANTQQALEQTDVQTGEQSSQQGEVITRHGQNLVVADGAGNLIHCLSRQNIGHITCGDRVIWHTTGDDQGVVTAVESRETALIRPNYAGEAKPLAANISQLIVVLAPRPEPSTYLVDQYLVAATNIGVKAVIALNKQDLLDGEARDQFNRTFSHYKSIGYPQAMVSAKQEHGLEPLIELLQGETNILVGQSGVGKSSLINALLPNIDLLTGQLSHATGLGRHTTSATTLYNLPQGGRLIDSPGVRSFRLGKLDRQTLERGFREFTPYIGQCKFSDCSHDHEPECALLEAVAAGKIYPQRLENFRHMAANMPAEKY